MSVWEVRGRACPVHVCRCIPRSTHLGRPAAGSLQGGPACHRECGQEVGARTDAQTNHTAAPQPPACILIMSMPPTKSPFVITCWCLAGVLLLPSVQLLLCLVQSHASTLPLCTHMHDPHDDGRAPAPPWTPPPGRELSLGRATILPLEKPLSHAMLAMTPARAECARWGANNTQTPTARLVAGCWLQGP